MRVGHATFKKDITQKHFKQIFTNDNLQTLSDESQWWLCLGIYKQHWKLLFDLMIETSVLKLELGRNQNSQIIKDIMNVRFINLKALCFGKNRIVNIQIIQYINAPNLQWLSFEENYITDIRTLKKVNLEHLKILNLKSNRIKFIELRQLNAPKLAKITLQFFHTDRTQAQSLNWVFSLQTQKLSILRSRSDDRIKSTLLQKAIKGKYEQINTKFFSLDNMSAEEDSESDHQ